MRIETRDPDDWARGLAAALADAVRAVETPGPVVLAIAGGTTPAAVAPYLASAVAWDRVLLTVTDERVTDRADLSNRAALAHGLRGVAVADLATLGPDVRPHVALIGFGMDRHVASVFPAGPGMAVARALAPETPAIVRATPDPLPPEAPTPRITFSLAALARAEVVIFAARGAAKRAVFEAACAESPPVSPLALLIDARARAGRATQAWFADGA